jgi:hypothetical protein
MARHEETIISGTDLAHAFGSYDSGDVAACLGFDDYESIDWSGFWLVSWPDHVITPRFNYDATYAHVGQTFAEASGDLSAFQFLSEVNNQ